ncbi:MAG TPA: ABC transporter permease subunit [Patescibacteria group bacterium]|jgi:ABC-2 type transport system permease protein|nr:ABC transporter permease subunit [Patescibacteria group bacterium]
MTSTTRPAAAPAGELSGSTWWPILRKELTELWLGGRLVLLLVLFTILMSITSVMRELENEANLIPPPEMVFLTVLSALSFGVLLCLVVGADSISGDRERGTFEPLLLSPVSRRRIVLAKFVAAVSPWPAAFLLSIPYVVVLGQGDSVIVPGMLWTLAIGTLLSMAFAAFGVLVSMWSRSNRTSLFVCLLVYLLFLLPTQLPGEAQKGPLGYTIQQLDPLQATSEFLEKFIVNNQPPSSRFSYLVTSILWAAVTVGLLFIYAAPRLQLEGGIPRLRGARSAASTAMTALLAVGLLLGALVAAPLAVRAAGYPALAETPKIEIEIDKDAETMNVGDEVEFTTTVTNADAVATPPMVVAMNIINLGKSDPVDPEDWSPQRTQSVDPLQPGESAEQSWSVEAVLDGNYMVYLTAIVKPGTPEQTTLPITSPGIHLTVAAFQDTNPSGVLPVAIGMPIALIVVAFLLRRYWRRDRGRASEPAAAA